MDEKKYQVVVGSKTKGSVRYDIEQNLSTEEQEQAKSNINTTKIVVKTWEDFESSEEIDSQQ